MGFKIHSAYQPAGDQPTAIRQLYEGVIHKEKFQTLLGVTGSGKTFTIANVIEKTQRPTLVLSHNKTLVAQLYTEFKEFFPTIKWSFLPLITIITNPKHTLPLRIHTSKKI